MIFQLFSSYRFKSLPLGSQTKGLLCVLAAASILSWGTTLFANTIQPTIYRGLVYAVRDGIPLFIDVMCPPKPNGAGILHIQSGGWYSNRRDPSYLVSSEQAFLAQGYTIFLIWHSNPPHYTVPDTVADVRRAARFVRIFAPVFKVDPNRLGAVGASSGGHLSLMLATTGDDGIPASSDPVERYSCRVATAVAINAPSDLRGWTTDPPDGIATQPVLQAPLNFDSSLEDDSSPVLHVESSNAPAFLIHGSADEIVPVEYSEQMMEVMNENDAEGDLLIIEGAGHAVSPQYALPMVVGMINWLADHLIVSS